MSAHAPSTSPVLNTRAHPKLARATSGPATWDYDDMARAIVAEFDPRQSPALPFQVLEAGGGSDCHLPLPAGAEITTLDISLEQLERNTYAKEKLHGDLQTFDFGPRRFDLIICWDVLEHLETPEAALMRLAGALKPGGRLLIKGPLPNTVKGLVTRFTPHALHVQFYKRILGSADAGKPGHAPFKAHLATGSDPRDIAGVLDRAGVTVDTLQGFESMHIARIAQKSRVAIGAYRVVETALAVFTFGHIARGMTDFFMIARKPE
jgi:SAM-dependent methyltransferase